MVHIGVSKRKPKKSRLFSNVDISGASNGRAGVCTTVHSLVKEKGAPINSGGMNPADASNKKRQKGKLGSGRRC